MCTARLFSQGVDLCTQILHGQGRPPATILGIRKLETLRGLPDGENCIPLRSIVLTQYRSVTDRQTDGRTDGRMDGFAVAYTALAKLALPGALKINRK